MKKIYLNNELFFILVFNLILLFSCTLLVEYNLITLYIYPFLAKIKVLLSLHLI